MQRYQRHTNIGDDTICCLFSITLYVPELPHYLGKPDKHFSPSLPSKPRTNLLHPHCFPYTYSINMQDWFVNVCARFCDFFFSKVVGCPHCGKSTRYLYEMSVCAEKPLLSTQPDLYTSLTLTTHINMWVLHMLLQLGSQAKSSWPNEHDRSPIKRQRFVLLKQKDSFSTPL